MARTDNDSWDLASSVGATATMVAAQRALASRKDGAIINDPFAEPLVRAVGIDLFTEMATGDFDPAKLAKLEELGVDADSLGDGMAARTKFFDTVFLSAAEAGIRQAVILASGLDTRAYRLDWPKGSVVYELDQPAVIAFKTETLTALGAAPSTNRRTVAIDLREDWPAALRSAGFDPALPTVWSAEGLLIYLPPEAQDRLFESITSLSAAGSRLGCEQIPDFDSVDLAKMRELTSQFTDGSLDLDMEDLIYRGERHLPSDWLNAHGWTATTETNAELHDRYGLRPPNPVARSFFPEVTYVAATLG